MTNVSTSPQVAVPTAAELIDQALDRIRAQRRDTQTLAAGDAKLRQLSALWEQEARLWASLVHHTTQRIYCRAAVEARCAALERAHEYAELARIWPAGADTSLAGAPELHDHR